MITQITELLTFRVLCSASICSEGTVFFFFGGLYQGLAAWFSESPHHETRSESSGNRSSPSPLTIGGDLEKSLNVNFMLSSKAYDGGDGMEEDVPSAEVTLTERSVPSLSWGFNVVEDEDESCGDLELGGEDS